MLNKTTCGRAPGRDAWRERIGPESAPGGWDGTVIVAESIDALDRSGWDSLFAGEIENWHYLRALERARLERCEPLYFAVQRYGQVIAAVPAFVGPPRLGEPWHAGGSVNGSSADAAPILLLGSPLGDACRPGFAPHATAAQRIRLLSLLLRSAGDLTAKRHIGTLRVAAMDEPQTRLWNRACESAGLTRVDVAPLARLTLPAWSLDDYLCGLNPTLRTRLWQACERAPCYECNLRVELSRDLERILALCGSVGLAELNGAYFERLLQPSMVCARCITVRVAGDLVGFSLVLHDAHGLREKLTVVRPFSESALVRSLLWLETVRFCLEHGIDTFESPSSDSIAAARPHELLARATWTRLH